MRWMSAVGLILLTSACSNLGPDLDSGPIMQINAGVTRKAEVERLLGAPSNRQVMPNGEESWTYVFLRTGLISSSEGSAEIYFRGDIVSHCQINHVNSGYVGVGANRNQSGCGDAPAGPAPKAANKRG
jgi:hypothetical protein